jgi:Asp-tRNA(Asn)/Glu-tRNA(Gln) amidotransferase A subunit family amidase
MNKMNENNEENPKLVFNRRRFVAYLSSIGLGSTLLPGTLLAEAKDSAEITVEMVESAARVAGVSLEKGALEEISRSLSGRRSFLNQYEEIRKMELGNDVPNALIFNPVLPGQRFSAEKKTIRYTKEKVARPKSDTELAFMNVYELAYLISKKKVTSVELTKIYLARLKKYDPILKCVVTLTEELALKQASQADKEIASGKYRGPLHGIPWGAKDLLAVKGYKTTFGASPYQDQMIDVDATVYKLLSEAGAVLVAKLTMGALAQGDRWFGGQTKSPWDPQNPTRGSSGSSAGPGSATAAGLVGFSIGTETRGSIISPSTRCGITGLRPTFGRVSRYGAMALSWSMDKIGPMCRSAEDCALVLRVLNSPDGMDNTLHDVPFNWDVNKDAKTLRVGYLKSSFEREIPVDSERPERFARARATRQNDLRALEVVKSLGIKLIPVELPEINANALSFILTAESAAAFDDLTRSGKLEQMTAPPERSGWVDTFRLNRFVPAVEYLQANRARYRLMVEFNKIFDEVDLFIGSDLAMTNLTGHPEICLPHGFDNDGQPTSLRITGKLFGDEEIALLAKAFQDKTEFHLKRPNI